MDYVSDDSDESMMNMAVDVASSVIDVVSDRVSFYRSNPPQAPFGSGPLKHSLKRPSVDFTSSNKRTAILSAHAADGRTVSGQLKSRLIWLFFPK